MPPPWRLFLLSPSAWPLPGVVTFDPSHFPLTGSHKRALGPNSIMGGGRENSQWRPHKEEEGGDTPNPLLLFYSLSFSPLHRGLSPPPLLLSTTPLLTSSPQYLSTPTPSFPLLSLGLLPPSPPHPFHRALRAWDQLCREQNHWDPSF